MHIYAAAMRIKKNNREMKIYISSFPIVIVSLKY